ncbi:hypothetical protein [Azospirillum sp. TSO5]|uniref:hypothetical protein n=1 Tax=Azospirillum sp. TSO5 TaxID=716760 RepID=UPI001304E229|nr:hypothetical protein [Azospirillum sp. TSO5]
MALKKFANYNFQQTLGPTGHLAVVVVVSSQRNHVDALGYFVAREDFLSNTPKLMIQTV